MHMGIEVIEAVDGCWSIQCASRRIFSHHTHSGLIVATSLAALVSAMPRYTARGC